MTTPPQTIVDVIKVDLRPGAGVGEVLVATMRALEKIEQGWRIIAVEVHVEQPIPSARRLRPRARGPHPRGE
jgi:hypothetical protein